MVATVFEPFQCDVDFSVVVSCYFEEQSIDLFYQRLSRTLQATGRSFELIFVNDGSTDGTFQRLEQIFDADPQVTAIVDLFKNAGQSNAKTPGVMLARGKAIVMIDSDLQLDPEELPQLIDFYDRGNDIVSGYRKVRHDPLYRRLPSLLANLIMRRASKSNLRDFGCTFKIYEGRLVRAFNFGPFNPWRPLPVIAQAGRIAEVAVNHHRRRFGQSGWTFRKLFAYNMENLVCLSERPFQFLGVLCFLLACLLVIRVGLAFVVPFSVLPRVTTGLLLNVGIIGLLATLSVLAAIGEFVIRNFIALQKRPAFIIRRVQRREGP